MSRKEYISILMGATGCSLEEAENTADKLISKQKQEIKDDRLKYHGTMAPDLPTPADSDS